MYFEEQRLSPRRHEGSAVLIFLVSERKGGGTRQCEVVISAGRSASGGQGAWRFREGAV